MIECERLDCDKEAVDIVVLYGYSWDKIRYNRINLFCGTHSHEAEEYAADQQVSHASKVIPVSFDWVKCGKCWSSFDRSRKTNAAIFMDLCICNDCAKNVLAKYMKDSKDSGAKK